MNLKNYTSTVHPTASMANIERRLIDIGASSINKQYDNKICRGITFLIYDDKLLRTLPFNLKAQVDECFKILLAQYAKPHNADKTKVMDQANRTAWKILSDWTEIQCSMILLGQATPLQMFLPFIYDVANNQTYFEKIMAGDTKLLGM